MAKVADLGQVGTLAFRPAKSFPVIDLGNLGTLGTAVGGLNVGNLGQSVSAAGDVNGDGIDDVIIGGTTAYVVFGQAGGIGAIDLDDLQPSEGFKIIDQFDLASGQHVSGAGDINGDGFDDIIVGGFQAEPYGSIPNAFVIFGKAGEFETVDVLDFFHSATSVGFRINAEFAAGDDYSGARVGSAGDFNGDGFDDMVVGTPYRDAATGAAYVIFGKAEGFENIDLANVAAETGFAIIGESPDDHLGFSVSGAGDVNGDGYDDIILGAKYGNRGGTDSGQAYVIFGREAGFDTIDLSNLDPGTGFIIQGAEPFGAAGWSVSGAGDVNGDGFDDVIVGAPYAEGNVDETATAPAGEAYVIFGKAGDFGTIDLSKLGPKEGFTIQGDDPADVVGWSVSGAGDLNADGFDEIFVGALGGDSGGDAAGEAFVIFGKAHFARTIDLGNIEDPNGRGRSDGFMIQGDVAYDLAGWSVSGAGDVDDDGVDDLLIGAPGNPNAGKTYILYGGQLIQSVAGTIGTQSRLNAASLENAPAELLGIAPATNGDGITFVGLTD